MPNNVAHLFMCLLPFTYLLQRNIQIFCPAFNWVIYHVCCGVHTVNTVAFTRNIFFFCQLSVPRVGVESELQLLVYTTATAKPGPSHVCYLHHSSLQCQILNPLSEARDRNCVLPMLVRFVSTEPQQEFPHNEFSKTVICYQFLN